MRCYACGRSLNDKEIMLNSDEDFIDNKCLCLTDLAISNELANQIKKENE